MDRPWVAADFASLLGDADDREEVRTGDAKSGSRFERVAIGGERFFFKTTSYDDDWIMRVTGDTEHRQLLVWQAGVYHRFPRAVDHTIVGMALEGEGPSSRLGILMRDVGDHLIPEGDTVVEPTTHHSLITDMAALHAAFWGWTDTVGLMPCHHRTRFFAPDVIADELERPDVSPVLVAAAEGWRRLRDRRADYAALVARIHADPGPWVDAVATTPSTFVPGDWKMGNLGRHRDGRTILLDCAYPGAGPGCWDLAWYLALNRARLPITKEATVEIYRSELQRHGVKVEGWFADQVDLCLLGMACCFGWEKALGDDTELDWWADRAVTTARRFAL